MCACVCVFESDRVTIKVEYSRTMQYYDIRFNNIPDVDWAHFNINDTQNKMLQMIANLGQVAVLSRKLTQKLNYESTNKGKTTLRKNLLLKEVKLMKSTFFSYVKTYGNVLILVYIVSDNNGKKTSDNPETSNILVDQFCKAFSAPLKHENNKYSILL